MSKSGPTSPSNINLYFQGDQGIKLSSWKGSINIGIKEKE